MRAAFEASPSRCGDRARTIHILEQDVVVESTRTRELLCPLELKSMSFSSSYLFDSDLHGIRYTTTDTSRAERRPGRRGAHSTPASDRQPRARGDCGLASRASSRANALVSRARSESTEKPRPTPGGTRATASRQGSRRGMECHHLSGGGHFPCPARAPSALSLTCHSAASHRAATPQ